MTPARWLAAASAALSLGAVATASVIQGAWGLSPCTMCILQRYAFIALGGFSLVTLCYPAKVGRLARAVMSGLAGVGMAASVKIQWALWVPSGSCGRDALANFFNDLPTAVWWPHLFEATGLCGDKVPPVLGVPFHIWSLMLFAGLLVLTWLPAVLAKRTCVDQGCGGYR